MKEFPFECTGHAVRGASLLLCSLFLLVSGCVQRQETAFLEETAPPAGDAFALAISRMYPGEQAAISGPYGPDSLVIMEHTYTSGLGQSCRRAQVMVSGVPHRIAVCRDESGWFTAGPIFENLPR